MENNNKYKNGKIYKIVSNVNDDVYYGSTIERTLARRLVQHRTDYKRYLAGKYNNVTSFKILETNDYDIVLVERVNCNSKEELHQRERFYIENNACVNKVRPNRTVKEWYNDNKEKIKEYREENKDDYLKYQKEYQLKNKDKLQAKNDCPCGGNYTTQNKSRHIKYPKHQSYLKAHESKQFKLSQYSFDFIFEMDSKMLLPRTYTNIKII